MTDKWNHSLVSDMTNGSYVCLVSMYYIINILWAILLQLQLTIVSNVGNDYNTK